MEKDTTVLVVDDEESIRSVVSNVLKDEGHPVMTASSGEEALEMFRTGFFPIIIADIRMRGMDGIELLRRVKESHPETQVIIITSYASLESAIQAMRYGAYDYLVKPFESIDQISFAVRKAAEKYHLTAENERLTKALKAKISRLSSINDLGQAMHSILDPKDLLNFFVQLLAEKLEAERVSLMLLDKNTNELIIGASYGLDKEVVKKARVKVGCGIAGRVAQDGRPMLVKDIERESGLQRQDKTEYSTDSFISAPLVLCVPIRFKLETIGVINLSERKKDAPFTEDDLEFVTLLANQAAHAIENARMFEELREINRSIKETHLGVITALADVLEAKDSHTGSHSNRMYQLAIEVGGILGLSADEKERLGYVAVLHDIGKIGVPESILQKPGRLTEEEHKIIIKHPVIGAEILNRISFLIPVAPLIRAHHERFDGKGYPDAIAGENIPIQSRIVAILDAYDAMTSDRPYRKAPGFEFAIRELQRCAGTQFDPKIVGIFISILKR